MSLAFFQSRYFDWHFVLTQTYKQDLILMFHDCRSKCNDQSGHWPRCMDTDGSGSKSYILDRQSILISAQIQPFL